MIDISDFKSAERVFYFFEEISKIPHGSGNTAKIADYLVAFADERGLEVKRDSADNVIIKKGATEGYETRPTVILQGHTDMVLAQTSESKINMETDGLELYRDGDFLRAVGTTLGGDDGVAVAYALALLDSSDLHHPPIEALFTTDEEVGLDGAKAIDPACIDGRIMINIDSDEEGVFTVGCAGGVRVDIAKTVRRSKAKLPSYKIVLDNLKGGHSGVEINAGRENAIRLLAEAVSAVFDVRLFDLFGGNADNAIPRYAECTAYTSLDKDALEERLWSVLTKYKVSEPDMTLTVTEDGGRVGFFTENDTRALLVMILKMPNGVVKMSEDVKWLVDTSLNLGVISTEGDAVTLSFSIRSASGERKRELERRVLRVAGEFGATARCHSDYPAWEYRKDSALREVMCDVYRKKYGKEPKVIIIHAGLECGIFSDKLDGLDCVSIGPDNFDIHTPEEHLSISSTARVWEYLLDVLREIK